MKVIGDCFAHYSFLDSSGDADELLEKTCRKVCAHNMWIRNMFQLNPIHTIEGKSYSKTLITISDDECIKFWSVEDGICLAKAKLNFSMNCIDELYYFRDNVLKQCLVIGGECGKLIVYDYSQDKIIRELIGSTRNVINLKTFYHKNTNYRKESVIISSHTSGEVRFWNWHKGVTVHRIKIGIQPIQGLNIWEFQPTPSQIPLKMIVHSIENSVHVWDPNKRRQIRNFNDHTNWIRTIICKSFQAKMEENKSRTIGIIISAGDDSTIRFFNILKGICVRILQPHKGEIISIKLYDNILLSSEGCGRIAITHIESLQSKIISTGLSIDYYDTFSLWKKGDSCNEVYLCVAGSLPRRSGYHFLNIYPARVKSDGIHFEI